MRAFRHGQWVRVGDRTGIAQYPRHEETREQLVPEGEVEVHFVDRETGETIPAQIDASTNWKPVWGLRIEETLVRPCLDRSEIPACRIAHLPLDWQPRP